ncbi:MAG: hypothetical protein ACD_2C00092G0004 [uncultured bacterium (gcode 4)]|uniref:Uncharacterized protein n=1 Tax=uncultured bacterium (gcode 4) TaxID=1234023 RepID=K2FF18_9BACT|nr:MAG: hypothetical protein ACD_2C00092G0004 [uncultured bacterium (gcode 4)]
MAEALKKGIGETGKTPENPKKSEKRTIIDSTKESLEIEKLSNRLSGAAGKLKLEIEWTYDFNSKVQKERWNIVVEVFNNERIFINSFWEKTEIKIENLGKKTNHPGLSISWKDWEIFSLWKEASARIWNTPISYVGYTDEDLIGLVWMANIINSALHYAKNNKGTSENPFFVNGTGKKDIRFSSWDIETIFWKLSRKNFILCPSFISHKWVRNMAEKHASWISDRKMSGEFMDRMAKYLNRRFFDEVVKKDKKIEE